MVYSHILRFAAFYFHFTWTCFVILVERWSGHDAWWGSSESAMEIERELIQNIYMCNIHNS